MLEPPSASLLKTLSVLRLCEPADLRRCRGLVKRLTRDLPAFDSIWIDALVQTRRLTAFQAQCLENNRAGQLVIGPCLISERLGGSSQAETFLARRRDANEVGVLKLTRIAPEQIKVATERMDRLVAASRNLNHPLIVLPLATQVVEWPNAGDWRFVTISRYVPGPHLAELLIRRGRFPVHVVVEIGRQILEALSKLEASGLVHGEVSLTNVRITPKGQAVLLDAGLVSVLRPQFSFHEVLNVERYDGMAPERITNESAPTLSSDLYSLGCLLWHLLAGRPPFPVGDPLSKLHAHQTQRVCDIREWVPDAPEWLAETLLRWTALDPDKRPDSIRDAMVQFWGASRAARAELKRFRGDFDRTMPKNERAESSHRWPLTVAAVFVLSGAVLSMADRGTRSLVLSVAQPVTSRVTNYLGHPQTTVDHQTRRLANPDDTKSEIDSASAGTPVRELRSSSLAPIAMPAPQRDGRIQLAAGEFYEAADVSVRGTLEISGSPESPPTIVIADQSCSLWGDRVRLQHVQFVHRSHSDSSVAAMLVVDAQQLEVTGCSFSHDNGSAAVSTKSKRASAAIAWRPQEVRDRDVTRVELRDVSIFGQGPSLFFQVPPATFQATNLLKLGDGDLIQCVDSGRSDWLCELHQVTARGSGSLLRCWTKDAKVAMSRLALIAEGCVLDIRSTSQENSQPSKPTLVTWMASRLPPRWDTAVEWRLTSVLVPSQIDVVSLVDPQTGRRSRVDDSQLEIDGLIGAPFEFVGSATSDPRDSVLKSCEAPLLAKSELGIAAERLHPATQ